MKREQYEFEQLFARCEIRYASKQWSDLAVDCAETFSRKVKMLMLERDINPGDMGSKELMDLAISNRLITNSKIHQLRMIRNDIVHSAYRLDKLDEGIIKETYKYLKPFFKRKRFKKELFKVKRNG